MKLPSFISRLQELNAYLEEFLPDTDGQETVPLPADNIINIIYHSIPITWKHKMIEQGFNNANSSIKEMSDFFESSVENLEPKEDRKIFSSYQEIQEICQEKEKGRLQLQCYRVQQRINQSLPSK